MFLSRTVCIAVSVVALTAVQAWAEEKEKEALAIVEIGGSGSWTLSGDSSFGPTVGIEFEPIKNWLEIEVGTGPMFGNGIREWDTDILFKKPFTLFEKVEFMIGAGPQWGTAFDGSTKAGVEFARFHVLANDRSQARLVFGAELQLHVCRRA
jgi:hypothetical protein